MSSRKIPIRVRCWWSALLMVLASAAGSADPLQWHDNSLTLLVGNAFEVSPARQATVTLEHVSGWNWGDLFVFMDATHFRDSSQSEGFYGEFSPRLSLSKLVGAPVGFGPVSDVLLAATREFGKGQVETSLVGPGFDLAIAGFDFFKLNLYRRIPDGGRDGDNIQVTPVWSMTTAFAGSDLIFDGFVDWNLLDDGTYVSNIHVNPQLKYDLSKRLGFGEKKLLVGIEYSYWKNKYGIRDSAAFDTNENVFSLLLKGHF